MLRKVPALKIRGKEKECEISQGEGIATRKEGTGLDPEDSPGRTKKGPASTTEGKRGEE